MGNKNSSTNNIEKTEKVNKNNHKTKSLRIGLSLWKDVHHIQRKDMERMHLIKI